MGTFHYYIDNKIQKENRGTTVDWTATRDNIALKGKNNSMKFYLELVKWRRHLYFMYFNWFLLADQDTS